MSCRTVGTPDASKQSINRCVACTTRSGARLHTHVRKSGRARGRNQSNKRAIREREREGIAGKGERVARERRGAGQEGNEGQGGGKRRKAWSGGRRGEGAEGRSECVAIATVAKRACPTWGSPWVEFVHRSAPHNVEGEGAGYSSGHVGTVSGQVRTAPSLPCPAPPFLWPLSLSSAPFPESAMYVMVMDKRVRTPQRRRCSGRKWSGLSVHKQLEGKNRASPLPPPRARARVRAKSSSSGSSRA